MTLPAKLILFLCLIGCFPPCQAATIGSDNGELYVTYLADGIDFQPFALFRNGESLIDYMALADATGNIWPFTLEEAFEPFEERLKKETYYGYMWRIEQPTQRDIVSVDELFPPEPKPRPLSMEDVDFSKIPSIVTNNPSPDFMADVKFTKYTLAEQDKVPEVYREYIRRKVCTAGLTNVPIIVKNIREFDFDNDGKNEAFIVANNYQNEWEDYPPDISIAEAEQLTAEEGIGYYSYALFYSETYQPIDFEATTALMHDTFFPSSTVSTAAPGEIYEYDKDGHIRLFHIYKPEEYRDFHVHGLGLIVCDINNDGLYDFIASHVPMAYSPSPDELYLQSVDGDFIRICSVYGSL